MLRVFVLNQEAVFSGFQDTKLLEIKVLLLSSGGTHYRMRCCSTATIFMDTIYLWSYSVVSYQHAGRGTVQRDSDELASAGGFRGIREILRQRRKYNSAYLYSSCYKSKLFWSMLKCRHFSQVTPNLEPHY